LKDIALNQHVMASHFVELGEKELGEVVGGKNMLSYLLYPIKPTIVLPWFFK
jgi:hypothetical protein